VHAINRKLTTQLCQESIMSELLPDGSIAKLAEENAGKIQSVRFSEKVCVRREVP
jgi:hypothetical protein